MAVAAASTYIFDVHTAGLKPNAPTVFWEPLSAIILIVVCVFVWVPSFI